MTSEERNAINQAAYLKLRGEIDRTYPKGRFVAIDEGRVIADAKTFEAIQARLAELGNNSPDVLVALAGDETPDYIEILSVRFED